MANECESEMCWICLEEAAENGSHQLVSPCKCPRKVHPQCLARWQLQQAGRHEEKFCRFCNNELADWKRHLTPEELKPEVSKVQPIMVVYFEGQIHRIPVKQGPDGLDEFTGRIRELFRLPEDVDISLTFGCKEPMSGTHLKLEGMGAFDAAVHCASVAAAERQQKIKKSYSTGNLGGSGAPDSVMRSASITNVPSNSPQTGRGPVSMSAAPADMSPATPPHAAGASAVSQAAQDRRQRFPAQQQQQQRGAGVRSRSFSSFNPSGPQSTSVEPPAAFRSILGMLNSGTSPAGQAAQGRGAAAPNRATSPLPQTPPHVGLPPSGPARVADSSGAAGSPGRPQAVLSQQQQQQQAGIRRERLSLRQISELKDVPEADETVAVGSLSGRFKLHLKAFSRKVARSLSFKSAGGAGSSASFGGSSASVGHLSDELAAFAGSSNSNISVQSHSSSRSTLCSAPMGADGVVPGALLSTSPLPPSTPEGIYTC